MNAAGDFDPPVGIAQKIGPGVQRILAPNPSPMTFRGTNTYLVGDRQLAVIDPGPLDSGHLQAILGTLRPGQQITHILVTHAHLDHSPLAAALSRETGAKIYGYGAADAGRSAVMQRLAERGLVGGGEGLDRDFNPDIGLEDGALLDADGWQLRAHWTPGHLGNHLCFQLGQTVFTGDLVMGWASLTGLSTRRRFDRFHVIVPEAEELGREGVSRRSRRTDFPSCRPPRLADYAPTVTRVVNPGTSSQRPSDSEGSDHANLSRYPGCAHPSGHPQRAGPSD